MVSTHRSRSLAIEALHVNMPAPENRLRLPRRSPRELRLGCLPSSYFDSPSRKSDSGARGAGIVGAKSLVSYKWNVLNAATAVSRPA